MSIFIAFDTSSDIASVALMRDGVIRLASSQGFATHSRTVLPMLESLLNEEGITVADCDAIAFGCGPGSFTGLRTACGIAQGLSFATSVPVVPVVTLEAMAESCRLQTGETDVLALLDARMHEVYWGEYRYENGGWQVLKGPCLSSASDVTPQGQPAFCGNGLTAYTDELAAVVSSSRQYPAVMPDAEAVVRLGALRFKRGEAVTAADVEPVYLRNKVALKTAERLALKEKTA